MTSIADQRWWSSESLVAVVTGANRGIGLEIVRQLAEKGVRRVILTARSAQKGEAAVEALLSEGLESVVFHKLDVTDGKSAQELASWTKDQYGGIDILVNNAGINSLSYEDKLQGAKAVIETNYYSVKRVIEAFLPIFKESKAHGRIINVSSALGKVEILQNDELKDFISNDLLQEDGIDSFIEKFLADVKSNQVTKNGWPTFVFRGLGDEAYSDYCVSKIALNAYTRLVSPRLLSMEDERRIYMNAMCPGYVRTDLNDGLGDKSVKEGADTVVWMALLHSSKLSSGKFFAERVEIPF